MRRDRGVVERSRRTDILEEMDDSIAEAEALILQYQQRLDNKEGDFPYTFYLQLTVSTNGPDGKRVQHIERMQYTGNLGPATKYLFERLLKKPMNYVKELRIAPLTVKDCFWSPAEMNLTARHLIIDGYYEERPYETSTFKLHSCPKYDQFTDLIDKWVIHGTMIGVHYTAYTSTTEGLNWYNSMKERESHIVVETPTRGCQCFLDCVILPLPNNAQLEFYMTPIVDHPHRLQFNLEVQPRI
ncbi:hypothetical protein CAEBREN_06223 [Caenorhabditis brenneri]|uniref:Uncharacterized protein n=1 Tax=Caenorhabditis brenneri TaxID=135651 RepID=G0P1A9_CAEBE|nr:hypothetical protein CAEBREN_06223 [Caenorhabditis brenneri]